MTRDDSKALWDSLAFAGRSKVLHAINVKSVYLQTEFEELPIGVQQIIHRGWEAGTLTPFKERGTG